MSPDNDIFDPIDAETDPVRAETDPIDTETVPIGDREKPVESTTSKIDRLWRQIPDDFLKYGSPQYMTRGSTGLVFGLGAGHVVKVIDCAADPKLRKAAEHEIMIMKLLKDVRGTVRMIDYRCGENEPVFILETRQTPLRDYIRINPFSDADALGLGVQICQTLAELRDRGILHLDISPKNICADGGEKFFLCDFGSALTMEELKQDSWLRGTEAYMAPEVYHQKDYSEQSEIYSLGVVLYTLLNHGSLPLTDRYSPARAVKRRLAGEEDFTLDQPSGIASAIRSALSFNKQDRPKTFEEFRLLLINAMMDAALFYSGQDPKTARPLVVEDRSKKYADEPFASSRTPSPESGFPDFSDPGISGSADDSDGFEEFDAEPFAYTCRLEPPSASPARPEEQPEAEMPKAARPPEPSFPARRGKEPEAEMPKIDYAAPSMPGRNRPFDDRNAGSDAYRRSPESKGWFFGRLIGSLFGKKKAGSVKKDQDDVRNAPPRLSEVQFSAVFPKQFLKGQYSILEMIMYEEEYRRVVDEAIAAAGSAVKEAKGSVLNIAENTVVSVRLECADKSVVIEGNDEPQKWIGKYLKFDFSVFVDNSHPGSQLMFTASVYFSGVIAARLRFTAECNTLRAQKLALIRDDVLSAFISYSREDQNRVIATIQGMRTARPDLDIFFDLDSIHTGEYWENVLRAEIERRDILYLCWSLAASRSEWVSREWHYALETKGLDSIEPIAIDQPDVCPPPEELASKHFNDRMLFFMKK